MTASVKIAGIDRVVPDSASAPLADSGVSPKSNFRSVLEQYHASRGNASESDDTQGATQQKHKDSDPTTTLAVPQPVTPGVEAPRLILPFTPPIALRQDASSSPDDTAAEDAAASPDDIATQDSTAATGPQGAPSAITSVFPTPVILRSTLDPRSLRLVRDTKTNSASGGTRPKTQGKSQAKSQAKAKDLVPSQSAAAPPAQTAPADPWISILPVTSSTTLEQAATGVQNSSALSEALAPDTVSTSTLDRRIAYQYRSSNDRPAETAVINRVSRQPQQVSDPTLAVTVPIPLTNPLTNTVEPQFPIHPPTDSNTPRKDAKASDSSSVVPQDSSAASGTDPKIAMPPAFERAEDTAAAPTAGALAFAARLTPTPEWQPPVPESTRPADPMPTSQTAPQLGTPATAKQIVIGMDLSADGHSGDGGSQPDKEKTIDRFARPDTLLPQMHVTVAEQTAVSANNQASTNPMSPAAHMEQVIDPPSPAPNTNHDITVRIPDSSDQGTAVRFVERAGEIHVSVRTGDVEMAQSLRGGLNDLVNHLEDGGIRTQVWQPGADASTSQNDSHHPFADPDGSQGRQNSSGSNSEQESRQHNKPRWVEELESSIGNPNFKETTQLLWQA